MSARLSTNKPGSIVRVWFLFFPGVYRRSLFFYMFPQFRCHEQSKNYSCTPQGSDRKSESASNFTAMLVSDRFNRSVLRQCWSLRAVVVMLWKTFYLRFACVSTKFYSCNNKQSSWFLILVNPLNLKRYRMLRKPLFLYRNHSILVYCILIFLFENCMDWLVIFRNFLFHFHLHYSDKQMYEILYI